MTQPIHEIEPEEELDVELEEHKEKAHKLLMQGLMGFGGGLFAFFFVNYLIVNASSGGNGTMPLEVLTMSLLGGCCCIGLPYGWELMSGLVGSNGGWCPLIIAIIVFFFKAAFAIIVGAVAYPISLMYHMFAARRGKELVAYIGIFVILISFSFFYLGIIGGIPNAAPNRSESTEPSQETIATEPQIVTAASFADAADVLANIGMDALTSAKQKEAEYLDNKWVVTKPAQILETYFMSAPNSGDTFWSIQEGIKIENAIVVVSGCFVEESMSFLINQWEMQIWFYPNCYYDGNGTLVYDSDHVFCHSIREESLETMMEWLQGEYRAMKFTALGIPELSND